MPTLPSVFRRLFAAASKESRKHRSVSPNHTSSTRSASPRTTHRSAKAYVADAFTKQDATTGVRRIKNPAKVKGLRKDLKNLGKGLGATGKLAGRVGLAAGAGATGSAVATVGVAGVGTAAIGAGLGATTIITGKTLAGAAKGGADGAKSGAETVKKIFRSTKARFRPKAAGSRAPAGSPRYSSSFDQRVGSASGAPAFPPALRRASGPLTVSPAALPNRPPSPSRGRVASSGVPPMAPQRGSEPLTGDVITAFRRAIQAQKGQLRPSTHPKPLTSINLDGITAEKAIAQAIQQDRQELLSAIQKRQSGETAFLNGETSPEELAALSNNEAKKRIQLARLRKGAIAARKNRIASQQRHPSPPNDSIGVVPRNTTLPPSHSRRRVSFDLPSGTEVPSSPSSTRSRPSSESSLAGNPSTPPMSDVAPPNTPAAAGSPAAHANTANEERRLAHNPGASANDVPPFPRKAQGSVTPRQTARQKQAEAIAQAERARQATQSRLNAINTELKTQGLATEKRRALMAQGIKATEAAQKALDDLAKATGESRALRTALENAAASHTRLDRSLADGVGNAAKVDAVPRALSNPIAPGTSS